MTDTDYQKTVDHLASGKAHTRIAALKAIGELGQDHPARRQTLADVVCGYLRLPPDDSDRSETQVRGVAQEVLRDHLRPERDSQGLAKNKNFWPDTNVNLSGAQLTDTDFSFCEFGWANFDETHFEGTTWFTRSVFKSEARFVGSIFDG
jgi:Pentapeptide repeats (9 copies)